MRTQEIAIRLALGAQRVNIARLVLVSGVRLGLAGCGLGVLGSWGAARLVQSFLFGVTATDPLIYLISIVIILIMVLAASALPAARAASSDPIDALRSVVRTRLTQSLAQRQRGEIPCGMSPLAIRVFEDPARLTGSQHL